MDDAMPLIIENGSYMMKAGFTGGDAPRGVFKTIVGAKSPGLTADYVGDEAESKRNQLSISSPMKNGIVTNWEQMEQIWYHTFYRELRVAPEEHPVLLTEHQCNPRANREKMTQIMFETFECPAIYVACSSSLALNSTCSGTGVVVDCGEGDCRAIAVYDWHVLPHTSTRLPIGGKMLTERLMAMLEKRFNSQFDYATATHIKERVCSISSDYNRELAESQQSSIHDRSFELPDDTSIDIGSERFQVPEALFQPTLMNVSGQGIHELIHETIKKADSDLHNDLYSNILLCGGSSMFSGIHERVQLELETLVPSVKIRVAAPPERKYSAYIGGSVVTALSPFKDKWLMRDEYDEFGASVVHRKCF